MSYAVVMAAEPVAGVTETVPTYRSLLVHYDPVQIGFDHLGEKILVLAQRPAPAATKARRWRIPVVYGGEHGIDLEDMAARKCQECFFRRRSMREIRLQQFLDRLRGILGLEVVIDLLPASSVRAKAATREQMITFDRIGMKARCRLSDAKQSSYAQSEPHRPRPRAEVRQTMVIHRMRPQL